MFFQRAVFQGLSQEALSACIQSLLKASDVILKNKVWLTFLIIAFFKTLFIFISVSKTPIDVRMANPVALLIIINVNSDVNKTLSAIFSPSAAAVMPFKVHLSRCFVTFGRQISNSHLQTRCLSANRPQSTSHCKLKPLHQSHRMFFHSALMSFFLCFNRWQGNK